MKSIFHIGIFLTLWAGCLSAFSQGHESHALIPSSVVFQENKGQWEDFILYKATIPDGRLFLEKDRLTYSFVNGEDLAQLHDFYHGHVKPEGEVKLRGHAFQVQLVGANLNASTYPSEPTSDIVNYYLGDNPSKWASGVRKFGSISYRNIYPEIDLHLYGQEDHLKYDFILHPGADEKLIQLNYEGVDKLFLSKGALHIVTSVNEIIEMKPYAYQQIDGETVEVPCKFHLRDTKITFTFPRGFDRQHELVIDPALIFSTYSGSPADNWGYTATYDSTGHLYAGGIVINDINNQYPTTLGAYDVTYNGGNNVPAPGIFLGLPIDAVVTKFSPDGTSLVYSTYLGGADNESPHSMVVNPANELFVLGTTGSSNFPTTLGAYDTSYNGGVQVAAGIISYNNGSDIFVSKFDSLGQNLLASTFVGGTGNDGLNLSTPLAYNYGDHFRGEIIAGNNNDCYIASSTTSDDFPTSNGAPQGTFGGGTQDGCAFRLSSDLSSLVWGTFIGGAGDDAAYSIQLDGNQEAYIAGGTNSTDFPTTNGALHDSIQGGVDGFVSHINSGGTSFTAATYLGTAAYDQCYFVQLDFSNNAYVVGQTEGSYPVTNNVYSNPNSGQFIHQLTPGLNTTLLSTVFGTGSGSIDIALSAFLVNNCDHIFVSGWGGTVNSGNGGPPNSTTTGLPWTNNAYQTTTDGSDFYIMVLEANATNLLFATFFGGSGLGEHVDGGTSRFDKQGIIYQAVCAGCGGSNSFPTTPGVWSQTNPSNNCNIGAIKYDLVTLEAEAGLDGPTTICLNDTVEFENLSIGGSVFFWDFDDNNNSNLFEPTHVYTSPGTYEVMLVIMDSVSCIESDTAYLTLTVKPPPVASISPVPSLCPSDSTQLHASGGETYWWSPPAGLSDVNIPDPIASPNSDITYTVVVYDSCSSDSASIHIDVHNDITGIMPDTALCRGQSGLLRAFGGVSYSWSPPLFLNGTNGPTPYTKPDTTIDYQVVIVDSNSCVWKKGVRVYVEGQLPKVDGFGDTTICYGDEAQLGARGGFVYEWSPKPDINNPFISHPRAAPKETTTYLVEVINSCGRAADEVTITVQNIDAETMPDVSICPGEYLQLSASGGTNYQWTGKDILHGKNTWHPIIKPETPGTYYVTVSDPIGCSDIDSTYVNIHPLPEIDVPGHDTLLGLEPVTILAQSNDPILWSPADGLECSTCYTTVANPNLTTTYVATATNSFGCVNQDSVTVLVFSTLYLPNTFTPNDDGVNDVFTAYGYKLLTYQLTVFDRWGAVVFESRDIKKGWKGTYAKGGKDAPIGVYAYKVVYTIVPGEEIEATGHVNLIR